MCRRARGSTMDFSQCTGKDDRSSTYAILRVSKSTRAAMHKLDELTDPVEKLTKPANTLFRSIFILRLSTQGYVGNNHPAWVGCQVFCTTVV